MCSWEWIPFLAFVRIRLSVRLGLRLVSRFVREELKRVCSVAWVLISSIIIRVFVNRVDGMNFVARARAALTVRAQATLGRMWHNLINSINSQNPSLVTPYCRRSLEVVRNVRATCQRISLCDLVALFNNKKIQSVSAVCTYITLVYEVCTRVCIICRAPKIVSTLRRWRCWKNQMTYLIFLFG